MNQKEQIMEQYAKKIYGFSFQKAGNPWDAEDLAQEILLVLCSDRVWDREIGNMDAYIYRICKYTWSNYVRKNVRHWRSLDNNALDTAAADSDPEGDVLRQAQLQQLRQEVLYLSALRRKIMVMFYYDRKKGDEIARELSIPAATVRWHLKQAKETIKERLEMTENTLHQPVRLLVGHCGNVHSPVYDDLQHDILTQNICWVCRNRALTMEEIARTLGVAAVYLEYKMERLLEMDYMRRIGGNKYRTAFYIWEDDFQLATERFRYDRALELGLPLYHLLEDHLPAIRKMAGIPAENDNFLLWALLPGLISGIFDRAELEYQKSQGDSMEIPKRSDGSAHWLIVRTRYRDHMESLEDAPASLMDYCLHGDVYGIKSREAGPLRSLQYDMMCFGPWRDFERPELLQLQQVYEIQTAHRLPTEPEKEVIAGLAEKGYVTVEQGFPTIQIPFLKGTELRDLIAKSLPQYMDMTAMQQAYADYSALVDRLLPKSAEQEEREFLRANFAPEPAILYRLYQEGYLEEPAREEKLRACTLVWENETSE